MQLEDSLQTSLVNFDPDLAPRTAAGLNVNIAQAQREAPMHRHRKGQLVLALRGGVVCEVPYALWMVPPHCAIWVPGGMPHSNRVTANAQLSFLFVEPGAAGLPLECCTLSISALVRELIHRLAELPQAAHADGPAERLTGVLLDELARMRVERLSLPITAEPRLRRIAYALIDNPSDRSTLAQWAGRVAMGERSLARLVLRETGLTFGRWRQQLHLLLALRQLSAGATVQQVSGELRI